MTSVDTYLFLAFSDLTCHLEYTAIGISWLHYAPDSSNVNICVDFVGRFSACYSGRQCKTFSDLCFGVALTFKLIAGFQHKLA